MINCPFCGEGLVLFDSLLSEYICFRCKKDPSKDYFFGIINITTDHFYIKFADDLIVNGHPELNYIFNRKAECCYVSFPKVDRTKENVLLVFEDFQRVKRLRVFT
jgi:hypothetical protein